jgi:hypothetical protein
MSSSNGIQSELERTAIREASHAVLQVALGIGCRQTTIVADSEAGSAGSAEHAGEWGGGDCDEDVENLRFLAEDAFWLRHAMACYARAEAPRQYGLQDAGERAKRGKRDAKDAINRITDDAQSIDLLYAYAARRTLLLIEHYRPEISAIANALLVKETLPGDEVLEIFAASLEQRDGRLLRW